MDTSGIRKFFGEQNEILHPGPLQWPGTIDGYPVLGPKLHLREDEKRRIPIVQHHRSGDFCLWREEEKKLFDIIMDRVGVRWFVIKVRKDAVVEMPQTEENPAGRGLWVWLEWSQIYGDTRSLAKSDWAAGGGR